MNTFNLDLFFREPPAGERIPAPAISHVTVKHADTLEYQGLNDMLVLTPGCYNTVELDAQINRLQEELEAIRRSAHEKYAAFRAKQEATVNPG